MTSHAAIASRLARHLESMGLDVERGASGLSASRYVEFSWPTEFDAAGDAVAHEVRKIRVSDHLLPPTYGALNGHADFECLVARGHLEADGDWLGCLRWAARVTGRALPRAAETALARRAIKAAKEADADAARKRAAGRAAWVELIGALAIARALAPERRAEIGARWRTLMDDSGGHASEKRRKFRRALEAELRLEFSGSTASPVTIVARDCMTEV